MNGKSHVFTALFFLLLFVNGRAANQGNDLESFEARRNDVSVFLFVQVKKIAYRFCDVLIIIDPKMSMGSERETIWMGRDDGTLASYQCSQ